jgi:hypothetical protein
MIWPEHFRKVLEEKAHSSEQGCNVDEKGLCWKKIPVCTFISKNEKILRFQSPKIILPYSSVIMLWTTLIKPIQ